MLLDSWSTINHGVSSRLRRDRRDPDEQPDGFTELVLTILAVLLDD